MESKAKMAEMRFITIGDSATGKSSLVLRYAKDRWDDSPTATVGVDLRIKTVRMSGRTVKLKIWDTAGQEQYRTITKSFYRGAHAVIMVYDITSQSSFKSMKRWMEDVDEYAGPGVEVVVIGNKCDLVQKRAVGQELGQRFCDEFKVRLFETSAKTGKNVDAAFSYLVSKVLPKIPDAREDAVQLAAEQKQGGCC